MVDSDRRLTQDEESAVLAAQDLGQSIGDPDVLLDVPKLAVEEIDLEVEELQVRVAFLAELADLVKINVGLDAEVNEVTLHIKGVEAQAQLKARLDNVRAIFGEVLESLEHSPQFFRQVVEPVGQATRAREDVTSDTEVADETDDASGPTDDRVDEESGEPEATEAARKKARTLGVDLSGLQGTGSGGRILVRDVTGAAKG